MLRSTSPLRQSSRRPKSLQACNTCRKLKIRCEPVANPGPCQRCKRLRKECSLDLDSAFAGQLNDKDRPILSSVNSSFLSGTLDSNSSPPIATSSSQTTNNHIRFATELDVQFHDATSSDLEQISRPLASLQLAVRQHEPVLEHLTISSFRSERLREILDETEVAALRQSYLLTFHPWLNIPNPVDVDDELLILAQCAVAVRQWHPDSLTQRLESRLRNAAHWCLMSQIFGPTPSPSAILALMMLSFWPPSYNIPENDIKDSKILLASAVSMAKTIHIDQLVPGNQSSSKSIFIKRNQIVSRVPLFLHPSDSQIKWISLSNIESMVCLGTDSKPTSRHLESDHDVTAMNSYAIINHIRDMRLGILAQLMALTEYGVSLQPTDLSSLERWHTDLCQLLRKFDEIYRFILPLHVVAKEEALQCEVLKIYYHCCRCLVIHQNFLSARRLTPQEGNTLWYEKLASISPGVDIIRSFGHDVITTSEAALTSLCAVSDGKLLSSAPDSLFTLIAFATLFVFRAKYRVFRDYKVNFPGANDMLISGVIERLEAAALNPQHAPAKYAALIRIWVRKWEDYIEPNLDGEPVAEYSNETSAEAQRPLDTAFLDAEIWSSFMQNILAAPANVAAW